MNILNFRALLDSGLVIFFTVLFVYILKKFASISIELISIGTDLNLFTFGFLFEIVLKAMKGEPFWLNYDSQTLSEILPKSYLLLLIFTGNALVMMGNFRLESHIDDKTQANSTFRNTSRFKYFLRPLVIFLGIVSLTIYLALTSVL